mmetsp:Transcript_55149/g.160946  ORF Transcript_55149/g.160946 Transcript_55149/m.160946 type:complete len:216 (-) Transcript_55149:262-909(-)
MMMTASKRLPRRKARITRVSRRILRMNSPLPRSPLLSALLSCVRYHGMMAARSMRLVKVKTQRSRRLGLVGQWMTSSVIIHFSSRVLSVSTSSVRMKAESSSRTRYSAVKRTTQTRSMVLKNSFGCGRHVSRKSGEPWAGQLSWASGMVEMMKLPVETQMAMKMIMDQILPRMLLSESSKTRKKRSTMVRRTWMLRSFHSEQNSNQPTFPFMFLS